MDFALKRLQPKRIIGCLIGLLLLASLACEATSAPGKDGSDPTVAPVTDWVQVYFTEPDDPRSDSLRGGPDNDLADAIRSARVSVDAAIYNLDLWSIRDALLDAHKRGLSVRVVAETDYLDSPEMQALVKAGIGVRDDNSENLMHNKFVVIDRQVVWTGSMNYTISEAYRNNNNLLRLRSSQLAANYTTEFEEMFVEDRFGPFSPANTPFPSFILDGTRIDIFFSPEDGVQAHLVDLLMEAQESIFFMAFSFTADEIAGALLDRAKAGVTVQGVMESSQVASNIGGDFDKFTDAGLDVRLDGNRYTMHHKVLIIDRQIVVTGSYNFTASAENRNDENLLIFYSPDIASIFLQEFQRVFGAAQ